MEVCRLYSIAQKFHAVERLWAKETVFSEAPSDEGVKLTLLRLKEIKDDLTTVIAEMEEEAWLTF